jgi:FtsZ-binding cell division protein ZapB
MELKRDEIIKALEMCLTLEYGVACKGCPLSYKDERRTDCLELLMKNALSLIKELTEENESLTETVKVRGETIEKLQFDVTDISEDNRKLTEENERLAKHNAVLIEDNHILATEFKKITIADTVQKIVERLEDFATDEGMVHIGTVRKITEEMIGDKND